MSKLTLRVFAVVGLLAASAFSAFSDSDYVLRVHVPFQFLAGQATLPAGDYVILQDGISGIVTLQNRNTRNSAVVLSLNGDTSLRGKGPHLVFRQINGRAVLTQIQLTDQPNRIMPTGFATASLK